MVRQQVWNPSSQNKGEMAWGKNKVTRSSNGRLLPNKIMVSASRRVLNCEMLLAE